MRLQELLCIRIHASGCGCSESLLEAQSLWSDVSVEISGWPGDVTVRKSRSQLWTEIQQSSCLVRGKDRFELSDKRRQRSRFMRKIRLSVAQIVSRLGRALVGDEEIALHRGWQFPNEKQIC